MHSSEFSGQAFSGQGFSGPGGFDPVDPPLFFSLSPVLLALVLLLVLLALAGGWLARERFGPRPRDGSEALYNAVRKAAEDAVKASRDEVHGKARKLLDVIERRLGGVLLVAGGVTGSRANIEAILDGRRPGASAADHGEADGHGPHRAEGRTDMIVVNTGQLVVKTSAAETRHEHDDESHDDDQAHHGTDHRVQDHRVQGHQGGGHPHKPAPAPGHQEQVALLRTELHAFADHWRDRARRLAELRRARANLA